MACEGNTQQEDEGWTEACAGSSQVLHASIHNYTFTGHNQRK